jgi:hypothetical protein
MRNKWTDDAITQEALKYGSIKALKANNAPAYFAAVRRKLTRHIRKVLKTGNVAWTKEDVIQEALKFHSIKNWRKFSPSSYSKAATEGFLNEITPLLKRTRKEFNLNAILETLAKYSDFTEWRKENPKDYDILHRKKLLSRYTKHLGKHKGASLAEKELLAKIQKHYPNAGKIRINGQELDIYIPELKLGIEYNGIYYHSAKFKNRLFHTNKTKFFNQQGIKVIHIWDFEWQTRKDQVWNFLQAQLGLNSKVGARNCFIDTLDINTALDFCKTNHIQGAPKNVLSAYGCYYKAELVGVVTLSRHHRNIPEVILSRLCYKSGLTVVGALSKFTKYLKQNYAKTIYTWVHKTLSSGESYIKAGWAPVSELPPDYFYVSGSGGQYVSKQSRAKKLMKTPLNMTELQHATKDGLYRVYDCGKIKLKIS